MCASLFSTDNSGQAIVDNAYVVEPGNVKISYSLMPSAPAIPRPLSYPYYACLTCCTCLTELQVRTSMLCAYCIDSHNK